MTLDALNQEFVRMLDKSGWNQSEVARKLALQPSTVSQYISGITRPSPTVIRLFKLLIDDDAPMPGDSGEGMHVRETPFPLEQFEEEMLRAMRSKSLDDRRWIASVTRDISQRLPDAEISYKKRRK